MWILPWVYKKKSAILFWSKNIFGKRRVHEGALLLCLINIHEQEFLSFFSINVLPWSTLQCGASCLVGGSLFCCSHRHSHFHLFKLVTLEPHSKYSAVLFMGCARRPNFLYQSRSFQKIRLFKQPFCRVWANSCNVLTSKQNITPIQGVFQVWNKLNPHDCQQKVLAIASHSPWETKISPIIWLSHRVYQLHLMALSVRKSFSKYDYSNMHKKDVSVATKRGMCCSAPPWRSRSHKNKEHK